MIITLKIIGEIALLGASLAILSVGLLLAMDAVRSITRYRKGYYN